MIRFSMLISPDSIGNISFRAFWWRKEHPQSCFAVRVIFLFKMTMGRMGFWMVTAAALPPWYKQVVGRWAGVGRREV